MTLYFLHYNNYYNRILKKEGDKVGDYGPHILMAFPNINFIPNDGITTTQIVNWPVVMADFPDYMFAWDEANDTGLTMEIHSRWFVIESKRVRTGQYEMTLYRDLLADYYDDLLEAPIFVEKGPLAASSSLLFNQEDMTTSQIRQAPQTLADASNIPWIVGYIPRDAEYDTQITADMNLGNAADIEVEDIGQWEYFTYTLPSYANAQVFTQLRYSILGKSTDYMNQNRTVQIFENTTAKLQSKWQFPSAADVDNGNASNPNPDFVNTIYYDRKLLLPQNKLMDDFIEKVRTDANYRSYYQGFVANNWRLLTDVQAQLLLELDNKTLYDQTTGLKYKVQVEIDQVEEEYSLENEPSMKGFLAAHVPEPDGGTMTPKTFMVGIKGYKIQLKLSQIQTKAFVNISGPNTRYHLETEPFDMFCIPYGDITTITSKEGSITQSFNATNPGTAIATQIAAAAGTDAIYDVQLLPYCPVPYLLNADGELEVYKTKFDIIYAVEGKAIAPLIWCRDNRFTGNIPFSIPDETDPVLKKLYGQTKLYRLTSPNYASMFEFNPYKNGGVEYFRIDATYRPFNPYIKIAPVFGGLYGYGGQYDGRGLILNGDFSLTQLSSAWANYQLQNKNYEAIFNRQIENIEISNKYQRIGEIGQAIAGSGQALMSGTIGGSMAGGILGAAGGGHGAAIGAVMGGVAGGAAGIGAGFADVWINDRLRAENLDLTKDQFGYNLGNIQALPYALSKTSALNINNPIFPLLEIYVCSPEEEQAFKDKITYNGMTVMTVGLLADYIPRATANNNYFKGKLIRLEGIADDTHILNAIASELNKGVYL